MTDLQERVRKFAASYPMLDTAVFAVGQDTYVVLFLGYQPQKECAMMVDNYYPAYQRVRRIREALEAQLAPHYTMATPLLYYKSLALLSGKACALRNCLTAHEKYGSWHVMEVLRVVGLYAPAASISEALPDGLQEALLLPDHPRYNEAWRAFVEKTMHPLCAECHRCTQACPTGALADGFVRVKCLRQWQAEGYVADDEVARRLGQRVLGCHTCQIVCPVNTAPTVEPEVDGMALWQAAQQGKQALVPFVDCLGYNYLRPVILSALCLNALGNARDARAREVVPQLTARFGDARIAQAVRRYLRQTAEIEREVKRLVCAEDYERLLSIATAADANTVVQTNYYFGTCADARARIRYIGERYILTVKVKIDAQQRYEHNADLTADVAERCLRQGLTAALVRERLGLEWAQDAPYVGALTTQRTTWCQDGLRLELDKNTYAEVCDYEIECEVSNDAQWQQAEQWIARMAPSACEGKGKQARFEQAIGLK